MRTWERGCQAEIKQTANKIKKSEKDKVIVWRISHHIQDDNISTLVCLMRSVPPQCCSVRLSLAVLMFFGFSVVYALRVNFSVAMVAMVNTTASKPAPNSSVVHTCPPLPDEVNTTFQQLDGVRKSLWNFSEQAYLLLQAVSRFLYLFLSLREPPPPSTVHRPPSTVLPQVPQYPWDLETQGWLLGAFFFGYLCTQIPGGYLSGHYGGSLFLGLGVLSTAVLTMLTAPAAQLGSYWLFALRVLEGIGEVSEWVREQMWALAHQMTVETGTNSGVKKSCTKVSMWFVKRGNLIAKWARVFILGSSWWGKKCESWDSTRWEPLM